MDEYEDLAVYRVSRAPIVKEIEVFKRHNKRRKKNNREKERESEDDFKAKFLERFDLDGERFLINLIKRDGKWMIEICKRKTRKCVYQDYETICNLMDNRCMLPDSIGYNVNMKV